MRTPLTMTTGLPRWALLVLGALVGAGGCAGTGSPMQVDVPLEAAAVAPSERATDLGYDITLSSVRIMVEDILLKENDAATTAFLRRGMNAFSGALIPSAHAHPGHGGGGAVVGELLGRREIGFADQAVTDIGIATALVTDVNGVDFLVVNTTDDDDLEANDPLLGHAAVLIGTATKAGATVAFDVRLTLDEDTILEDAPALASGGLATDSAGGFALHFLIDDPFEDDSFFDGVEFSDLATDDHVLILPGMPAHDRLRRSLVAHDYYKLTASGENDES